MLAKHGHKFYVKVGTIKAYLRQVNLHYISHSETPPYDARVKSRAVQLLDEQAKFEEEAAKRDPLADAVILRIRDLAVEDNDKHGFRQLMWDITNIIRFAGLRRQEYAMEKCDTIQYYLTPAGQLVMRAFAIEDIKFFFPGGVQCPRLHTLSAEERASVNAAGLLFKIQKNRRNKQLQRFLRNIRYEQFCFVESAMRLVENALFLGNNWHEPLCIYRAGATVKMLTGDDVTAYWRFVTQLVYPSIGRDALNLISTHSGRVYAAVKLHEAGKDATYIKLRLRWESDCFLGYLRNTEVIMEQHNVALDRAHTRMLALGAYDLPDAPAHLVPVDASLPDLEDDD